MFDLSPIVLYSWYSNSNLRTSIDWLCCANLQFYSLGIMDSTESRIPDMVCICISVSDKKIYLSLRDTIDPVTQQKYWYINRIDQ
jgi:hypothetical protein